MDKAGYRLPRTKVGQKTFDKIIKTGRKLKWSPEQEQFIGDDEANRLLQRPYRAPWIHPKPESA